MSDRQLKEPVKLHSSKHSPKRDRYWLLHGGRPERKIPNRQGMQRRLARTTILTTVVELGRMSDVAVIKTARAEDLIRNLSFVIHQQRLFGALVRLKKSNPFTLALPPKVEQARLASAHRALEGEKKHV